MSANPQLESKVSDEVGRQEQPLDRESTCPMLLRMFYTMNGRHHFRSDYDRGATPARELQIYTWMDATLRELTNLIKEVNEEARRKGAIFNFSVVYPDNRSPIYRMREIGQTVNGTRGNADSFTLKSRGFVIGDFLDVAITLPKTFSTGNRRR
ncbi:hypothetical protein GJ496_000694 [Pomphorhynchus laevis]|nr:hypothetical protein GJ496_000694 [Pomphorhynchus laevis]